MTDHDHHHQAPPPAQVAPAHAEHAMPPDPLMDRARTLGSGTALLPATSPMRMWSLRAGDWLWMFHGDLVAGGISNTKQPSWAAENWQMAMGSRYWGPGILDLRAMTSLEPFTTPAGGTPQLFQAGETWLGQPLVDRQHPHDLLMELAARYTWTPDDQTQVFLYGGPVGEPALGPTAFMHRPSAADNHWAPLSHHLQDSTHYVHGVATVGARRGAFQVEGSAFNGREPDEDRVGIRFAPLDSWSARLTWIPGPSWTAQVSHGFLHEPEAGHPGDVRRTTASVTRVVDRPWGRWSSTLVWGQNVDDHGASQSYGLENQLDVEATHGYARVELLDRLGGRVGALTLGAVRDLDADDRFDLGLGADVTAYSLDSSQVAAYGDNPLQARVYLRLRPPTH